MIVDFLGACEMIADNVKTVDASLISDLYLGLYHPQQDPSKKTHLFTNVNVELDSSNLTKYTRLNIPYNPDSDQFGMTNDQIADFCRLEDYLKIWLKDVYRVYLKLISQDGRREAHCALVVLLEYSIFLTFKPAMNKHDALLQKIYSQNGLSGYIYLISKNGKSCLPMEHGSIFWASTEAANAIMQTCKTHNSMAPFYYLNDLWEMTGVPFTVTKLPI